MRKIREVLRLTHELGLSVREVREATGVGKTAVSECVRRAKVVGISWPIPPEIGDAALEGLLFTPAAFHEGSTKRLPDWSKVHEELKRRGVTRWEERPDQAPRGSRTGGVNSMRGFGSVTYGSALFEKELPELGSSTF